MWPFRKKTVSDALIDEIKSEPLDMGNLMGSKKNMNQLESLSKEKFKRAGITTMHLLNSSKR